MNRRSFFKGAQVQRSPDRWSCKMRCVAKRYTGTHDIEGEVIQDWLYTFANIDSDGGMIQVIEDGEFCEIGGTVSVIVKSEQ